jgi:RND family efflux transporter MFP subunit
VALQEVEQLKAQLLSGESSVKLAEKKLADTSIRAPFPGTVKERRVSAGEYLRVQSPVAVIVRTDQLRARMEVPEKWAGAVRAGAPVEITVDAFPGEVFRAQVTRISPSVSQETRTFLVEALLANRDARLKPGFFVQASIASDLREKALFVPEKAVFYRYGVYKVFVVGEGEKLEEREVKTGTQEATRIEILEGLKPGNRVAMAVKGEITAGATARQVSP